MKKISVISVLFLIIVGCTSKTIYSKPNDLIPKDSMSLLLKDLFLANAAKNIKNVRLQRRINYHPLVYEKFKIDSSRFETSNFYYISRIDDYEDILEKVILSIEADQKIYIEKKKIKDSIFKDSIKKINRSFNRTKSVSNRAKKAVKVKQ